jgi:polysaccharide export outer membrane protein
MKNTCGEDLETMTVGCLRQVSFAVVAAACLTARGAPAQPEAPPTYEIQPGDLLTVSVWKEPELQSDVLVRPDGGLTFPLAGDITAVGRSVDSLRQEIEERLKRYIPEPVVTVAMRQIGGSRIYVLGQVNRPGDFVLSGPVDVMQALSLAGGATAFASLNDIIVLRRSGTEQTAIHFAYQDVVRGRSLEQNILLRSGDTVVVP